MALTVLSVAYPLATVTPAVGGGAEQVLATLDRALVRAGHRSIVLARAGSEVAGELAPLSPLPARFDDAGAATAHAEVRFALGALLARESVDLVHCHGIDFAAYLPPPGPPVLATLHLPSSWYPPEALDPSRPDTWIHCVSDEQHRDCPPSPRLLAPIPNGIDVEAFASTARRGSFALFLGRICPEKGVHLAIEAAGRAGCPLVIAGPVYPFDSHLDYFDTAIRPRLGPACRYLGGIGFRAKRRLLAAARCLLVPALAPETSSLVVREAAASGTPAIAFPTGAVRSAIIDGETGFLVEDVGRMAEAIGRAGTVDSDRCRTVARERFSDAPMIAAYLALYANLARRHGCDGRAS